MTTKKEIMKKLENIDLQLDQNLSIVEATEKLEGEGLISFSFSYRESQYDSWLQVESYIQELNKVVIVDYEAPSCFDNIEDFVDILLLYEKEVWEIRSKIKIQKVGKISETKEILERFGITPTQENIELAMRYNQDNLIINLENAAIGYFELLKGAVKNNN